MDRLDLSKMVDKQIRQHSKIDYFNLKYMKQKQNGSVSHTNPNGSQHSYHQGNINGIFAHIYTQLREAKTKPRSVIPHVGKSNKYKAVYTTPNPSVTKDVMKTTHENPLSKTSNIPRLKVLCDHKEKKRRHNSIPTVDDANNFVSQKRLSELKQQNAVFTSMLEDQRQIQQDLSTISKETSSMRNNLNDLHNRLNCSMKMLSQNKTVNELNLANKAK
ncbi:uncharacterized protein LOC109614191 [Musca domestica]|uniref:Uncharacterized protein LOC109614191 n=1 Tax=Musca domestica TaxID=7370 RepID=A0A9J7IJB0_MUSDO|nr:uncharacterized protein LOC109614191 [Musca domestica]